MSLAWGAALYGWGRPVVPWSLGMGAAHTITQREEAGRAGRSRPGERDWVSGRNRRKAGGMRIWNGRAGERSDDV